MYTIQEIMIPWLNGEKKSCDKSYDMIEKNYIESGYSLERTIRFAILVSDGPFMDYEKARYLLLSHYNALDYAPWYIISLYAYFWWLHYGELSLNIEELLKSRVMIEDVNNEGMYALCMLYSNRLSQKDFFYYANYSFNQNPSVFAAETMYNCYLKEGDVINAKIILQKGIKSIKQIGLGYNDYDWTYWRNYINSRIKQIFIGKTHLDTLKRKLAILDGRN